MVVQNFWYNCKGSSKILTYCIPNMTYKVNNTNKTLPATSLFHVSTRHLHQANNTWSEIAKRDLISLCSWELLRNYDTVNTCYNYKDAVDTMRLLILLTASSSFASNSVSPIDLDTRITCCRTSSILRIALINSGKLILANRLMIRQKYLIMLMY